MSTFLIYLVKSVLIFIKRFIEKLSFKRDSKLLFTILILSNALSYSSLAEFRFDNYLDLDELKTCLRKSNIAECRKLISILEKLQIEAVNKGNLKCQSTLLGIQTELIKNHYFEENNFILESIIYPNLIKNC